MTQHALTTYHGMKVVFAYVDVQFPKKAVEACAMTLNQCDDTIRLTLPHLAWTETEVTKSLFPSGILLVCDTVQIYILDLNTSSDGVLSLY